MDNYYFTTLFYPTYVFEFPWHKRQNIFGFIMAKLWCNNIWAASLEFSIPPLSPLNLGTNLEFQVEFLTCQTCRHIEQVSLIMFSNIFYLFFESYPMEKNSLRDIKRWCILKIASEYYGRIAQFYPKPCWLFLI